MMRFIYRCPRTGLQVQGMLEEHVPEDEGTFAGVSCAACGSVHLVNPRTGRTLGSEKK